MTNAIARRIGCTEGQLYTMVTGLVLAFVLAIAGVGAAIGPRHASSAPVIPAQATTTTTTDVGIAAPPGAATVTSPNALETTGNGETSGTDLQPAISPSTSVPITTVPSTTQTPPPSTSPCTAGPVLKVSGAILDALEAATHVVPSTSTEVVLSDLFGCSPGSNPTIDALAVLAQLLDRVPAPGVTVPGLPPIPQLPASIIALLQPFRSILDPACTSAGTASDLVVLGLASYPPWISSIAINALIPVLEACGQIQPA